MVYRKHGLSNTRINRIWSSMKTRCYNSKHKSFHRYGGRGVYICNEWLNDFMSFYNWAMGNGYSEELTIDRIDNDGNYEPSNCRWAGKKEQSTNKSLSKNNNSGYSGVSWNKASCKWGSSIDVNNKKIWLGVYKTKEGALAARNQYISQNNLGYNIQEWRG